MKRWLIILLLLSVPFQMVWAAAAPYCAHESGAVIQHFGHHEHSHVSADGKTADDNNKSSAGSLHSDCGSCHLAHAAWVTDTVTSMSAAQMVVREYFEPRYTSCIPAGPERPQRACASSAVRFGGGAALLTHLI